MQATKIIDLPLDYYLGTILIYRPNVLPSIPAYPTNWAYPAQGRISLNLGESDELMLRLRDEACFDIEHGGDKSRASIALQHFDPSMIKRLSVPCRLSDRIMNCLRPFSDLRDLRVNMNSKPAPETFWKDITAFAALRTLFIQDAILPEIDSDTSLNFPNLQELILINCDCEPRLLKRLFDQCPGLRKVILRGVSATPEVGNLISASSAITDVFLGNTVTDPELFRSLSAAHHIANLTLDFPEMTDAIFAPLQNLRQLKDLYITNSEMSGSFLMDQVFTSSLENLSLHVENVSVACLCDTSHLPRLRSLNLAHLSDACVDAVTSHQSLRGLSVSKAAITQQGSEKLGRLRSLQGLYLPDTQLSGDPFSGLSELTNLIELDISGIQITDDWLQPLKNMPSLASLKIDSRDISVEGFRALADLPLTSLVMNAEEVDENKIIALGSATTLQLLIIRSSFVPMEMELRLGQYLPNCRILIYE